MSIEPGTPGSSAVLRSAESSHRNQFCFFRGQPATNHGGKLVAVDHRHRNIEEDDVRSFVDHFSQRIACISDEGSFATHRCQQTRKRLRRIVAIIHHHCAIARFRPCWQWDRYPVRFFSFLSCINVNHTLLDWFGRNRNPLALPGDHRSIHLQRKINWATTRSCSTGR